MAKYTFQQKLLAVKDYLQGLGSLKTIAREHDVDISSLRMWVAGYKANGVAGIKDISQTRRHFTPEFKLAVIERMQKENMSCRQATALFNLRKTDIVFKWLKQYESGGFGALSNGKYSKEPKMKQITSTNTITISSYEKLSKKEMLGELKRLQAEVDYLKKLEALVLAKKASVVQKKQK